MATRLWILRHGEAEPHGLVEDSLRQLTPTGEQEARDAGSALIALGESPVAVFSSPRVRAIQTADLACEALGLEPVVHRPLSSGFRGSDALELLAANSFDGTVVLVGHMPDLAITIAELSGAEVALRTGGLALLRGETAQFELAVLLRPRETRSLAAGA
ncbi:MAG: phosphoglycerate mutase family protein [Actinomycetes bacterium]